MSSNLLSSLVGRVFRTPGSTSFAHHGEAVYRTQAVVEYRPDGQIVNANPNFLAITGYSLDELLGRHQRTLLDPADAESPQYAALWDQLLRGSAHSGEYRVLGKRGHDVWLQGVHAPVLDRGARR
jgi:methyl-accepting chemotaxis protein